MHIPKSVKNIEKSAFGYGFHSSNHSEKITVAKGNKYYDSRDNCNAVIETKTNTLINGCAYTIIPNSVRSIGTYAFFDCDTLKSITIPNGVKSIGGMAFFECDALERVTIPNSVTQIHHNIVSGKVDVYVGKGSYAI